MDRFPYPSTGLNHLDELLSKLQYGDNVVWQVDDIQRYRDLVVPFVNRALAEKRKTIYIRFAQHEPLLEPRQGLEIIQLDADTGFETFSSQVHRIISDRGRGAFYVFDSLSDLLTTWATDLMVGNFFMVTCPHLYEWDTIAYFAILRDRHSYQTVARIRGTTQLLLDVYHLEGTRYIHPLKVWNRYSPTMFLPHRDEQTQFTPVTDSVDAARLFSYISNRARVRTQRKLDYWDRLYMQAESIANRDRTDSEYISSVDTICRIMLGREERMLSLIKSRFTLKDLIDIKVRMIGTGFIGGKTVGMLLARKILAQDDTVDWLAHLENHDSFYIGSDIFHSYIVQNGLWKLRMEQKTTEGYFTKAGELSQGLLKGKFATDIREQFQELIEYFGQSPIIVRSSSLLEDSFGNAFAGKYESVFLANQGSPEDRYEKFEEAVRVIYSSTMSEDALIYRRQRGLDKLDEQMALLVQRVSGAHYNGYFFPDAAGVGVSYNTFVWNRDLDPKAGMLRVVAGLGTRAVDRADEDYPRLIALDKPLLRPHSSIDNIRHFSQHYIDIINIRENQVETLPLNTVLSKIKDWDFDLYVSEDHNAAARMKQLGISGSLQFVLTFDKLLTQTDFVGLMRQMLSTLESTYNYPVDIEFTLNFTADRKLQINLLQCRPLQAKGVTMQTAAPAYANSRQILFKTFGSFMGGSVSQIIDRVIYVDPAGYIELTQQEKHEVARLIGKINRLCDKSESTTMLMGPGRWGTSTPSLGVPVRFSEINQMSVLCEISYPGGNLMPELSYGSHFFMDLVEYGIFYIALFCEKADVQFKLQLLSSFPNRLADMLPEAKKFDHVLFVYEMDQKSLLLTSDIISQSAVCSFVDRRSV